MVGYSETNERKRTYIATDTVSRHIPTVKETKLASQNGATRQTRGEDEGNTTKTKPTCVINVLIVDDHALIREGLRQLFTLEEYICVVGEAANGFEAIEKIRQLLPDVVLLDIHLPIVDGIAVTRQITHEFPNVAGNHPDCPSSESADRSCDEKWSQRLSPEEFLRTRGCGGNQDGPSGRHRRLTYADRSYCQ